MSQSGGDDEEGCSRQDSWRDSRLRSLSHYGLNCQFIKFVLFLSPQERKSKSLNSTEIPYLLNSLSKLICCSALSKHV